MIDAGLVVIVVIIIFVVGGGVKISIGNINIGNSNRERKETTKK